MIYRTATRLTLVLLTGTAMLSLPGCGKKGGPEPIQASESPVKAEQLSEIGVSGAATPQRPGESSLAGSAAPILADAPSADPTATHTAELVPPSLADTASSTAVASPAPPAEPFVPLNEALSPYLRAAADSPVKWSPWASQSFARAAQEGKPVLICIGANWSHVCKLMDQEAYSDSEVARILNEEFVAIRVDRDERPDLDDRYQAAHALITREAGGYPLTVFALPDGRPFESVGYVAKESRNGKAGMKEVLRQVASIYAERRSDAEQMADAVERSVAKAGGDTASPVTLDEKLVHRLHAAVAREYDPKTETFGDDGKPKFPAAIAAVAMLHYHSDFGDKAALDAAADSLSRYFRSGLRDNVMGGYFRYTEDAELRRPRYEKLLSVQAEMLSAHCLAHAATGKYLYKEAANDILRFVRDTFESRDGGFYASQDADLKSGDDGSYFAWSAEEVQKIAGKGKDAQVFLKYLNVPENGQGPLYPTSKMQGVADALKIDRDDAIRHLDDVRDKLHEARMQQDAPYVNKTLIASWNSAMIGAYLDAYKYLGDTDARDVALKSATFLMANMISPERGVARSWYKGQASGYGFLDDNVRMADALLQCFEVSGRHEYLDTATSLMEFIEARFLDPTTGLYVDRVDAEPLGLLRVARRSVSDGVIPSSNALAALNWYRLYQLSMKEAYQERATRLVSAAAGQPGLDGLAAATLSRAAALLLNGAPKALIVGPPDDEATQKMHQAALKVFRSGKVVEVLSPEEAAKTDYKPAKDGRPVTYVCTASTCAPPVRDAEKIADVVRSFGKPESSDKDEEVRTADASDRGDSDSDEQ